MYLRFNFNSESSNSQDAYYNADFEGFTFDDFTCLLINDASLSLTEENQFAVSIYPNPVKETLTIQSLDFGGFDVQINSAQGQIMFSETAVNDALNVDMKSWRQGVYFIQINGVEMHKVIKL